MQFIGEIHENDRVVSHYFCKSKQTLSSKAGKNYLSLKLQDKTGVADAKVWDMNNSIQSFEEGDYIKIDATALLYNGELQLKVAKIRRSEEGEYDPADYIPATSRNIDELYEKILSYIKNINNFYIKELLTNILVNDSFVVKKLKTSSAAKSMHHNYMGGLIEHTVSVTEICDFVCGQYPFANRDILIASALLHDIGKIYELSDFPQNEYTDDGELLGHIVIGSELIGKEAALIQEFPPELESLLKHCILSHHGEYEYGSPKLPKIVEAFILHIADNMDAKVKMYEDMTSDGTNNAIWLGYNRMLERNIRRTTF